MSSRERMLSVVSAAVAESSRLFGKLQNAEALHAVDRCLKRMTRGHRRLPWPRGDGPAGTTSARSFDNASDACQAAIAMQRRTADLPPVSGIKLAIRIGFHHGPVVEASGKILGDGASGPRSWRDWPAAGADPDQQHDAVLVDAASAVVDPPPGERRRATPRSRRQSRCSKCFGVNPGSMRRR
jgi:hypothetical protein